MDPKIAPTLLPPYWKGVRRNHVAVQQGFTLAAFDTETFFGRVFALGFCHPDGRVEISHGLGKDHVSFFVSRALSLAGKGKRTAVLGAHYLVFDLGVLFWDLLNPRGARLSKAPKRSHFSLLSWRCEIEIFWGRPCFAKIRQEGRTIYLIDTWAFFGMSLKKALELVGAPVQKQEKPQELGKRIIPLKELRPYLESDVRGAQELLKEIQRLHEKYETRLCVSLPQLSSRIFRHYYLKKDFPQPTGPLLSGALLSYHGGKNSFVGRPGWFENCWDLDINSAYPEAMAQLPDFERGHWKLGRGTAFLRAHPHGIYLVSGHLKSCPWGCLYSHDFKKISGKINGLWTTGYEILEAVRSGEIRITKVRGYGFIENRRRAGDPALRRFVAEFYRLKSEAKSKTEGYFYKLILNSLYGKFIQRTEDDDGNFVAGSMFDPAVASLITGYVRARLHFLEHKYRAIHTATDGFITQRKPDPRDLGSEIGLLKSESKGRVLILRNKLYLFFGPDGKLVKSGLHGFEGNPQELEKLWRSSRRIYHVSRLVKWGEAWHIGIPPGQELKIKKELRIN